MSEFQMTHVALVGARMDAFYSRGFRARNELAMRRVVPVASAQPLGEMAPGELRAQLAAELPLWVHNIVSDRRFPARDRLTMSLRRFEGELRDNRDNEVVASVLSAGFRNRPLDPLNPPGSMPMRQRCALLMQIGPWRDAFQSLEKVVLDILCENSAALDAWVAMATDNPELEPEQAVAV